ncbi:MAG: IS630 family transposase [Ardenticatenaceae bacterium]|nr:IS630 family transposase [Ardenticatenaceae bacterium]MCB9418697.1 IS630 family transposase [Ardenticatenaceae bacterium]MCB9422965.1 IS630 family transposase [Ardenticatenaceae bacterium]MCB9442928.1 IS630 family transposase [Ardenticatenaceae bacterium]MCB9444938.1 IS630 family transposase [Ardenticatenaceae bacterium]
MIKLQFAPETINQLHHERTHHPHPRVRQRMEVVYLKALGLSHQEIGRIVRISQATLREYLLMYQQGGIETLKELNFHQPKSDLDDHQDSLRQEFERRPPATIDEAVARIEKLTGLRRSPTQVAEFLKKLGLKRRKVGQIPAKADPEKQQEFLDEELTPRLADAQANQRHLFFVDAAHFVLQPFLGFLWSFVRHFIKAPAGRQRFNVLGALHATTRQLVTVTNTSYINAHSVAALFYQLAASFADLPITVVLDNARYQHCHFIKQLAADLRIELLFLPPYSPNLNLIERLWKFVKKQCLYSQYYEKFADFRQAIEDCLADVSGTFKDQLASLLTLNFQTFENVSL